MRTKQNKIKHNCPINNFCSLITVCVFLASGYKWVTVMHEIPISSAHTMNPFHTLGLRSTTPLVPLGGAVLHKKVPTSP
jgi:hypothetical protein